MKKTKQYQKGKHFYIKSGRKQEIHKIKKPEPPETEFDENYQEVYIDQFYFKNEDNKIKIFFGKKIHGTDKIKLKRTIILGKNTAQKLISVLSHAFHTKE